MIEKLKRSLKGDRINVKSMVAMVIFGAIALVFVLFGYQTKTGGPGAGAAASVNGTLISLADVRSESSRLEKMYGAFFGGNLPPNARRQITSEAVDSLISHEVLFQAAQKAGFLATDAEVRNFIVTEMKAFQRDGRFSREQYVNVLDLNHMTAPEFEDKVRRDLIQQKARRAFEVVGQPSDIEVEKQKQLKEMKYNFSFVKFNKGVLLEKIPVADTEIQKRLADPEFKKRVENDFNSNKSVYSTEESIHAQHILVKVDPTKPDSDKAAFEKINDIKAKSKSTDFAKLASQYSEDAGSKTKGGDLGTFGHGKMMPEFEAAAFALAPGQVSAPVKTQYGYHLIKVLEKKQASEAKFENWQKKIASRMIAAERYDSKLKELETALAAGDQAAVDKWIKGLNLSWDETGFFDLAADAAPKLASIQATQSAFETNEKQPLLKRLVRDGDSKFIIKYKSAKRETIEPRNLIAQLTKERSSDLFDQWIQNEIKNSKIEKNQKLVEGM